MTSVFLSYARADDEPFVRRLHNDLTDASFDVWFDRDDLRSRGLTFHHEIREAIRACDRLVLVVGPKAVASEYVRQEWQFGWFDAEKVVTPILRRDGQTADGRSIDGYSIIPDELKLLHCEDFRGDAQYPIHLKNLIASLSAAPPPLGQLIAVPNLPTHFLTRTELLTRLRDAVRAGLDSTAPLGGTAVHQKMPGIISRSRIAGTAGMGGIGKSVLACLLARDRYVREAFPDGIVWIVLGSLPNLEDLMRRLHGQLGGDGVFQTEHEGRTKLKELLADKSVLLILDDAWRKSDVEAFDVLGPTCRSLITTRDAQLLTSLGGTPHLIDLLTNAEALQLLAVSVGKEVAILPPEATAVLKECGRLPLAVALAGGMIAADMPWNSLLTAFRRHKLEFFKDDQRDNQHHDLLRTIEVSVLALEPDEQSRLVELGVFPEDEAVPAAAVDTLWQHTNQLDQLDRQTLLIKLKQRSLLQLSAPSSTTTVGNISLHGLIHDYCLRRAQQQFGNATALHELLLAAYRAKSVHAWHTGPNDGYFFQHLRHHLIESGRGEELTELLLDLSWLDAKANQDLVFDLIADYAAAQTVTPQSHAQARLLPLLEQALRRDVHFIARNPATLFQCLWNSCWWHDAPEAARYYESPHDKEQCPETLPWLQAGPKLYWLLEQWRDTRRKGRAWRGWSRQLTRFILGTDPRLTGIAFIALAFLLAFAVKGWLGDILASLPLAVVVLVHLAAKLPRWARTTATVATGLGVFVALEGLTSLMPAMVPYLRYLAYVCLSFDDMVFGWLRLACLRLVFQWRVASLARREGNGGLRWLRALRPPQAGIDTGRYTVMTGHQREVTSIAVSANGTRAASMSADHSVRVWDIASGQELSCFQVPLSGKGCWLALTSDGGRVLIADTECAGEFDADCGTVVRQVEFDESEKPACQAIADGQIVRSGDGRRALLLDRNGILLGNADTQGIDTVLAWTVATASRCPDLVAVSPSAKSPATHHYQVGLWLEPDHSTLRLWDGTADNPLAELVLENVDLREIRVASSGAVAACSSLRRVLVWRRSQDGYEARWSAHPKGEGQPVLDRVQDIAFSSDGRRLAAGFNDGSVVVWDVVSGKVVGDVQMHVRKVLCVCFTPDGKGVLSGAEDRSVVLWQPDTTASALRLPGEARPIIRIGWLDRLGWPWDHFSFYVDDSGGQRAVYNLLTGVCTGVTNYKVDANDWVLAFMHRPYNEDLARWFWQKATLSETSVHRSTGEFIGMLPGLYGMPKQDSALSDYFGALNAHPSGYYWVGYQESHLCLFQLECD